MTRGAAHCKPRGETFVCALAAFAFSRTHRMEKRQEAKAGGVA
jgi:hypothetical protein